MPSRSRSVTPRRRASTRLKQTADGPPEPREEQAAVLTAAAPVKRVVAYNWLTTLLQPPLCKPLWPLIALFLLMKYEEVNNCAQGRWHSLSHFWHCSIISVLIVVFCFTWEKVWDKCYKDKTHVMVSVVKPIRGQLWQPFVQPHTTSSPARRKIFLPFKR